MIMIQDRLLPVLCKWTISVRKAKRRAPAIERPVMSTVIRPTAMVPADVTADHGKRALRQGYEGEINALIHAVA